jgi:hypothetical protein
MTTRYATLSGKKLLDPREALNWAAHNHTPRDFWLKANSICCPLGKDPGSAFVLLTRRDLNALAVNGLHSLVWTDNGTTTTFADLVIANADCMSLSLTDPDSCYLVELVDKRQQLKLSAINAQYNVRVPAGPRQTTEEYYYPESLNAGALWTWQTMLDDMWGELPAIAGTSPTLPYSPGGNPESLRFIGVNAWNSYHAVIAKLGCEIKLNPFTGVFSLVRRGQAQAGLAAAMAALSGRRVYDYNKFDPTRTDSPETIRVYFHKRAEDGHGTEKDTPRVDNWEMSPAHEEDVASAITGAEVGTVLPVWDDLPALVDENGTVTNTAALATRAAEVAANIAARIAVQVDRVHYGGCITTILPGEQVSKVVWRDYADGHGLVTEVHSSKPEEVAAGCVDENLQGPDLARRSHPVYPDLAQQIVVYHESAAYGEFVEANSDGLHPGYIVRVSDQETTYLERIWILFTNNFEIWAGQVLAVQESQHGPARLSGVVTSDGETYPLYRLEHGEQHWQCVNQTELTQGGTCDVEIYIYDTDATEWGETGIVWPAVDWFLNDGETMEAGYKMIVKWEGPILVITAAYCSVSDDPVIVASLPTG